MKKLIALLLSLVMVFAMASALAVGAAKGEGLRDTRHIHSKNLQGSDMTNSATARI